MHVGSIVRKGACVCVCMCVCVYVHHSFFLSLHLERRSCICECWQGVRSIRLQIRIKHSPVSYTHTLTHTHKHTHWRTHTHTPHETHNQQVSTPQFPQSLFRQKKIKIFILFIYTCEFRIQDTHTHMPAHTHTQTHALLPRCLFRQGKNNLFHRLSEMYIRLGSMSVVHLNLKGIIRVWNPTQRNFRCGRTTLRVSCGKNDLIFRGLFMDYATECPQGI